MPYTKGNSGNQVNMYQITSTDRPSLDKVNDQAYYISSGKTHEKKSKLDISKGRGI